MRSRTEETEDENREVFWKKMISCILNVLNNENVLSNIADVKNSLRICSISFLLINKPPFFGGWRLDAF